MLSNNQVIRGVIDNTLRGLYINSNSKENYNLVISFLDNLTDRFITKYNLSSTNNKSVLTNYSISRVEKTIQKVIEVNRVKEGNFSFFNKQTSQRLISIEELETRAKQEYDKFFSRAISSREITNISNDVDPTSAQQMVDFETAKFIFYTPTSYNIGDKSLDLSQADISIFDEKIHDTITNNMFVVNTRAKPIRRRGGPKSRRLLGKMPKKGKTKLLTTLATRKPFKKSPVEGDDPKFENVQDYLGPNSPLLDLNLGTRRKDLSPDPAPTTLIRKSFAQNRKITKFETIS